MYKESLKWFESVANSHLHKTAGIMDYMPFVGRGKYEEAQRLADYGLSKADQYSSAFHRSMDKLRQAKARISNLENTLAATRDVLSSAKTSMGKVPYMMAGLGAGAGLAGLGLGKMMSPRQLTLAEQIKGAIAANPRLAAALGLAGVAGLGYGAYQALS